MIAWFILVLAVMLSACAPTAQRPAVKPMALLAPVKPQHLRTTTNPSALNSIAIEVPEFTCIPQKGNAVNNTMSGDWVNSSNAIEVPAGWIWIGAASPGGGSSLWLGGLLDIPYLLQDITSGTILAWSNWDHYGNPVGINDTVAPFNWAPYYALISQGDTIRFTMGCAGPYSVDVMPVSVQGLAVLQYLQPSN